MNQSSKIETPKNYRKGNKPGPDVVKYFRLNSAEHEILNAHKYKNIKKYQHFSGSDKSKMLFCLLINVKMPTTVGILTYMNGKILCSAELSMEKVL